MPRYEDLDWRGLKFSEEQFDQVMNVDRDEWVQEIASHDELFFKLYDRLPRELPVDPRPAACAACGGRRKSRDEIASRICSNSPCWTGRVKCGFAG